MRKTRLVLIPGVKSLDTIGCLLLFLACPTIAFKGQENREVDTICKAQNLKEFWVDSPWPRDADNIGWARGYGGGTRPGYSKEHTCSGLPSRTVVRSSRSDDRRVQARREASRDNGMESRQMRMENDMRRAVKRDFNTGRRDDSRNARRATREEQGREYREVRENWVSSRASRSLDRETRSEKRVQDLDSRRESFTVDKNDVRMRLNQQRVITTREQIDGKRNFRASSAECEIRYKREVREPDNRRAERLTVRNREAIDGRRELKSIHRQQREDERYVESRNIDSRIFHRRAESYDRLGPTEGRVADSRRVGESTTNSRSATRSHERSGKRVGERVYRRDSRSSVEESEVERRVANTGDMVHSRRDQTQRQEARSETRMETKRRVLARDRTHSRENERRAYERSYAEMRRVSTDQRDFGNSIQYRSDIRKMDFEKQVRDRTAARRLITAREEIDGRRQQDWISTRPLDRQIRTKREIPRDENREKQESFTRRMSINVRSTDNRRDTMRELGNNEQSRMSVPSGQDGRSMVWSFKDIRSVEERRIDNRRLTMDKRESRLPTRSIERGVRSVRSEFLNVRVGLSVSNLNRKSADRQVLDKSVSPVRLQRSTRSLDDIRAVRVDGVASRFDSRREVERDSSRLESTSYRFRQGAEEKRIEQTHTPDSRNSVDRETSIRASYWRRSSWLPANAERADNRRERLTTRSALQSHEVRRLVSRVSGRTEENLGRAQERTNQRLAGAERTNRLLRDNSRSQRSTSEREIRAVDDNRRFIEHDSREERREDHEIRKRRLTAMDSRVNIDNRNIERQTILRKARSLEQRFVGQRFDRRRPFAQTQRESSPRLDSSREGDNRRGFDRATPEMINMRLAERYNRFSPDDSTSQRSIRERDIRSVHERRSLPEREILRDRREGAQKRQVRLSALDSRVYARDVDSQTLLRKARSLEDIRRFDRRMPIFRNQRDSSQLEDTRRADTRKEFDRASPERTNRRMAERHHRLSVDDSKSQREKYERAASGRRSLAEREIRRERHEGQTMKAADFRAQQLRDARDTEINRISSDVVAAFKSRAIPNESRRSERQSRVDRATDFMEKRQANTVDSSIRRFSELADEHHRRINSREIHAGKPSIFRQEIPGGGEDGFFNSYKNVLASWLTKDMSRTDFKGISETLMYGGIACFALFSNVYKRVIF